MRLVRFKSRLLPDFRVGLGALLDDVVVDLEAAHESRLEAQSAETVLKPLPIDMVTFLEKGPQVLDIARLAIEHVKHLRSEEDDPRGPNGKKLVFHPEEIHLLAPIARPGKILCMGLNFYEHVEEQEDHEASRPEAPTAFIKVSTALIGPEDPIFYPAITKELDYEVEVAAVIGKRGKSISREKASEHIAGYTILNDISARDIQGREMKTGILNFGKNIDGFAPMGPCLTTRDQIGDPADLELELSVNGEIRQKSNTKNMIFKFPEIIEYFSRGMTLEPGDVFTSGTPSGIALFRRPDPKPWYLKPGDLVEAKVENIGVLRNRVEPARI